LIGRSYLDFVRIDCLPQDADTHPARQLALEGCDDQSVPLTFVASTGQVVETELRAMRHVQPRKGARRSFVCSAM
jgi:hypothetical protein